MGFVPMLVGYIPVMMPDRAGAQTPALAKTLSKRVP